jgi:predicted Zn-dependent protease
MRATKWDGLFNSGEIMNRYANAAALLLGMAPCAAPLGNRVAIAVGADAAQAHYSQKDEAEADSEGVVNTVSAGIDPAKGLLSFLAAS